MRKHLTFILSKLASFFEFCIALMLAIGIALLCLQLAGALFHLPGADAFPDYEELLAKCFNLIIGVELIRMMYCRTADTVFEVLVFAIARQVIVDHGSAVSSLIGVCALAVLFVTRKYFYFSPGKQTAPGEEPDDLFSEPTDEQSSKPTNPL